MIHPDTELRFISAEKGYGLVAKKMIPKGTITWVLDRLDRSFSPMEVDEMDTVCKDIIGTYTFRNNQGNYILCWDNGRFVNHSFNSNCLTTAYDYEIAIRDIQEGEEVTDDYGYLNIESPFRALPEKSRRKIVYPDDLKKYYKSWDKKLQDSIKCILSVPQPLKDLLSHDVWQKSVKIANGMEEMDSILNCFYEENGLSQHGTGHQNGRA